VVDDQSRRGSYELLAAALSLLSFPWYAELRRERAATANIGVIRAALNIGRRAIPWHVSDDSILYGGRVFVPRSSSPLSPVRKMALTAEHKGTHQTARLPQADSYIDHGHGEPLTVMCARLLRA
jgi:hypothetical protein